MRAPPVTTRLYWAIQVGVLALSIAATVWVSQASEWQPLTLVVVLLALTLGGDRLSIETHSGALNPSFYALMLAMSLLGPAPAVAFGLLLQVITSARRHVRPAFWLGNLTAFAVVPLVGGLMVKGLSERFVGGHGPTESVSFAVIVFSAVIVAFVLNFTLIALDVRMVEGRSLRAEFRELFFPLLSGELAAGVLVAIIAVGYQNLALPMLVGSIVVIVIYRHLMVALLRSEERAEKLEASTLQLAGMQWGVLRTLARVVNGRDPTTGPHAAATARYAKALAADVGLDEEQQEMVHTAALLHEIGKFGWPDRLLHGELATDEDMEIVRRHPQEGAALVSALQGYGAVADAILYHHERMDGGGYPAGLIGNEIPQASRILAIVSTYDAMTAGRPHRPAMTPEEATEELRVGARNGQLDPELVERFIALLSREGSTFGKGTEFEEELDFRRHVSRLAHSGAEGNEQNDGKNREAVGGELRRRIASWQPASLQRRQGRHAARETPST
ncbi:MAG TPA: HD domain-containing phosphohydrolase [Solirubrobacteraceae bacterium]|nr:HD domain-containing phosphohydrolase [Solirubrobacteraceae bacterium]